MSAGSPQASWSAAMNRPSGGSHRYGPLGPSQKPVLFVDQPQVLKILLCTAQVMPSPRLRKRVQFQGRSPK